MASKVSIEDEMDARVRERPEDLFDRAGGAAATALVVSAEPLAISDPVEAARLVLGATLSVDGVVDDFHDRVDLKIVEVEAYGGMPGGPWPDPAAHSYRGRTARNQVMFGPAGHLYVYRSYGMHFCLNVSTGPPGEPSGVLLRGGRVIRGEEIVRQRRGDRRHVDLARGPGNLGSATGVSLGDNGVDLFDPQSPIRLTLADVQTYEVGPRVGVSAAFERPWRLWIPAAPEVSAYRRSPRAGATANTAW